MVDNQIINIGKDANIDLQVLVNSRLLVQANSGGGKSWILRKILEESNGKVQQIVLDLEGEFSTLREKYDYLLVGSDGDIPADIKSSGLLAKKVLQLGVSVIIDLYELKQHERIMYVKNFLDSMINAPKSLWHPCLVVIDEAHIFAPEKGKSEALSSVIELCTRGRKRGYCAILATQRLSKLNKDAVAECNNKLIGRTGLDLDMKRVADELGFTGKDKMLSLRNLKAGDFWAFGPAMSPGVNKIKVGMVKTNHPQDGGRQLVDIKPATNKIKSMLSKLSDLPQEAEKNFIDLEDYKREVTKLRSEITRFKNTDSEKKERLLKESSYKKGFNDGKKESKEVVKHTEADKVLSKVASLVVSYRENIMTYSKGIETMVKDNIDYRIQIETKEGIGKTDKALGVCAKKIYSLLFCNPSRGFSKVQIGMITGYSHKSGGFSNSISSLNARELIRREGSLIYLGLEDADIVIDSNQDINIEFWFSKLGKCSAEIFRLLLDQPSRDFSKKELGETTGYSYNSGGFSNSISKLNTLEIIKRSNGMIKLNPDILDLRENI